MTFCSRLLFSKIGHQESGKPGESDKGEGFFEELTWLESVF